MKLKQTKINNTFQSILCESILDILSELYYQVKLRLSITQHSRDKELLAKAYKLTNKFSLLIVH